MATLPQASVSTAFSSSPKLSRVFLELDRNTEYMFSIPFRKHRDEKNGKQLVNFDYHHYVNSSRSTNRRAYFLRTVF